MSEDLAYIAGLFDGEGNVHIHVARRRGQKPQRFLQIKITNTNKEVVDFAQKTLKLGSITSRKYPSRKREWVWRACSRHAAGILENLMPYLKAKQERAKLAIKFQSLLGYRNFHLKPLSESEIEERETLRRRIMQLNGA